MNTPAQQTARPAPPAPAPVLAHEYDGIREYDNPTPGWWGLIFFLSLVWAAGYWVRYELNTTPPTIHQEWENEVAEVNKALFAKLGKLEPDEPTLLSLSANPDWMRVGEAIFRANCVACHGRNGQGDVGPNLTDDSYKNIKVITDIPRVVREGANNQAMPAWRGKLNENEMVLVSSYVVSLRGQNLSGRAAEGEKIAPWPKAPAGPSASEPEKK